MRSASPHAPAPARSIAPGAAGRRRAAVGAAPGVWDGVRARMAGGAGALRRHPSREGGTRMRGRSGLPREAEARGSRGAAQCAASFGSRVTLVGPCADGGRGTRSPWPGVLPHAAPMDGMGSGGWYRCVPRAKGGQEGREVQRRCVHEVSGSVWRGCAARRGRARATHSVVRETNALVCYSRPRRAASAARPHYTRRGPLLGVCPVVVGDWLQ